MTATETDYDHKNWIAARADPIVRDIISCNFVGVKNVEKTPADSRADIDGADYIVSFHGGGVKRIDVKARMHDYKKNDVVLELISNLEECTAGWALRSDKTTDLVIFVCVDTGTYHILPFPQLMRVAQLHYKRWRSKYRVIQQTTQDKRPNRKRDQYTSQAVIVPVKDLVDHIISLMTEGV